jgi:L-asparaginase
MPKQTNVEANSDAIRILVTGGTFDKHYDAIKGELTFTDSHLPAILKQARLTIPYDIQLLPLIDSLNMDDAYRTQVLSACQSAPEAAIIVIHGTDTMAQTARVVGAAKLAKTIVFTGAMVPYSVQGSDALFNLGFAVAAAFAQPIGTYIAMNGRVFLHDDVAKNKVAGVFESGQA